MKNLIVAMIVMLALATSGCKSVKKALGIYHPETDIYGPPTVEGVIRNVPDDNVVHFYFMRPKPEATVYGYVKNSTMFVAGDTWYDIEVTTGVDAGKLTEYVYVDRTAQIAYLYNSPVQRRAIVLRQVPPGYTNPGRPSAGALFTKENEEYPLEADHDLY